MMIVLLNIKMQKNKMHISPRVIQTIVISEAFHFFTVFFRFILKTIIDKASVARDIVTSNKMPTTSV